MVREAAGGEPTCFARCGGGAALHVGPEVEPASCPLACPLCSAPPGWKCGLTASHLARWLRAFALCLVTRDERIGAVCGLVVVTAAQLVEERAA